VLAAAYVGAARRRWEPARPLLVVVALLSISLAGAAAMGGPLDAGTRVADPTLPPDAFRPVRLPDVARSEASWPTASATLDPSPSPTPIPTATPVPVPAAVIRFRPRDGWTNVSRFADVSVRFSLPMSRDVTQAAFHATIGDTPVTGRLRWAERDTVLVLSPSEAFPYGATVELAVGAGAMSAAGGALETPARVSFVVEPKPRPAPKPTPRPSAWQWPLTGRLTQLFGQTLTQYGVHQGIDIDGDIGDPVRAARPGRVIVAGYADECGGLQVRLDHGDGVTSWYRHLSRVNVAVGARVGVGQLIGRVGATGCVTGSHLHFGIRIGSTFVDPLRYLPPR
jgi:murein DD-endopeptidase MepM/ murein hydrolase activator NlpD